MTFFQWRNLRIDGQNSYFFILLWVYLLVPLYEVYIKRKTLDDQLPIILGLEHGSQCSWGGSVPVFALTSPQHSRRAYLPQHSRKKTNATKNKIPVP